MMASSEAGEAAVQMPQYQSHKKVWALKILSVDGAKLIFEDKRFAPAIADFKMFARYTPVPGDYYVQYDDGYRSISPAKAFEEGYTKISG